MVVVAHRRRRHRRRRHRFTGSISAMRASRYVLCSLSAFKVHSGVQIYSQFKLNERAWCLRTSYCYSLLSNSHQMLKTKNQNIFFRNFLIAIFLIVNFEFIIVNIGHSHVPHSYVLVERRRNKKKTIYRWLQSVCVYVCVRQV